MSCVADTVSWCHLIPCDVVSWPSCVVVSWCRGVAGVSQPRLPVNEDGLDSKPCTSKLFSAFLMVYHVNIAMW